MDHGGSRFSDLLTISFGLSVFLGIALAASFYDIVSVDYLNIVMVVQHIVQVVVGERVAGSGRRCPGHHLATMSLAGASWYRKPGIDSGFGCRLFCFFKKTIF